MSVFSDSAGITGGATHNMVAGGSVGISGQST